MSSNGNTLKRDTAPWHEGERALQAMAGMRERMEGLGRAVLRDFMPDQHRAFFTERNQVFLALMASGGQPWATVIEGEVGFVTSATSRSLEIAATLPSRDPAAEAFQDGVPVGALGLEFDTRRRNRVNGLVRRLPDGTGFAIDVMQSFGNCPQFIQARRQASRPLSLNDPSPEHAQWSTSLSAGDSEFIRQCDTFFIASRSRFPGSGRSEGLDMSHRGGPPGFVTVQDNGRLTFPDYRGNFFFNTLGNLQADPRCGILFFDFATGATLQLAGRAALSHKSDADWQWPGVERVVSVDIDAVVRSEGRSRYHWKFLSHAPQFAAKVA